VLRNILVPLDGSRLSEDVLPVVAELVRGTETSVTLFTVDHAPEATRRRRVGISRPLPIAAVSLQHLPGAVLQPSPPGYVETRDQAVERRKHELLEYLDKVGQPLIEAGSSVHAAVHFGEPADEIVAFARRGKFDLIAMATHGHTGLRQAVQGSVAAAVVASGVAPVLLVRPKARKRNER